MTIQTKVVPIAPSDVFRTNPYFFTGYVILGVVALVVGVSCWATFRVQVGTSDTARLVPPAKHLLTVAVVFVSIALCVWFLAITQYMRIFRLRLSTSLWFVVMLELTAMIMLVIISRDLGKDFLECVPPQFKFSPEFQRCIPVCPRGYYLDTTRFVCVPGCQSDKDCPSSAEVCTHGKCCDLSTHTLTSDGQCCPNQDVMDAGDGVTTVCCPSGKVCGNECCLDANATCDPSTNTCRVPCGASQQCSNTQICLHDEATNLHQCVPYVPKSVDSTCQVVASSTIPSNDGMDFFPAIKNTTDLSEKAMTCNPYDETAPTNCRQDILRGIQTKDPSIVGYTCGLSSPVQFKSTLLRGDCTLQDFIATADPASTDQLRVIQVDNQHFVVNQRLNPLRTSSPLDSSGCRPSSYVQDCSAFAMCDSDECPFQHDSKNLVCTIQDGVGVIKDATVQSQCDVYATPQNAPNKTTWTFLDARSANGSPTRDRPLMYGALYYMKANDDGSKFNQLYLSAQGTKQAPSMQSQPWKWRILSSSPENQPFQNVRTGDVVVLQSYDSVGTQAQKYDRMYVSTFGAGGSHQPSMNAGEGMSSVEDGKPTDHELWILYDDTYLDGRPIFDTTSPVYLIKYVKSIPNIAFGNMGISLTGCGSQAPCMMGNVRSLAYRCSKQPTNPRNACPKNGKCSLPTLDTATLECHSVSGETRPLLCRSRGADETIQAMCCDAQDFQRFLDETPNFPSNLTCDTDGYDAQTPIYGDSRHRQFCTTPQLLPLGAPVDVQGFNEKTWNFHPSSE